MLTPEDRSDLRWIVVLGLIVASLLYAYGCGTAGPAAYGQEVATETATGTVVPPTDTSTVAPPTQTPWFITTTPEATWTPLPTYTPPPTQTPWVVTATPSSTPTPTATWTPSPTITPDAVGTAVDATLTALAPTAWVPVWTYYFPIITQGR